MSPSIHELMMMFILMAHLRLVMKKRWSHCDLKKLIRLWLMIVVCIAVFNGRNLEDYHPNFLSLTYWYIRTAMVELYCRITIPCSATWSSSSTFRGFQLGLSQVILQQRLFKTGQNLKKTSPNHQTPNRVSLEATIPTAFAARPAALCSAAAWHLGSWWRTWRSRPRTPRIRWVASRAFHATWCLAWLWMRIWVKIWGDLVGDLYGCFSCFPEVFMYI